MRKYLLAAVAVIGLAAPAQAEPGLNLGTFERCAALFTKVSHEMQFHGDAETAETFSTASGVLLVAALAERKRITGVADAEEMRAKIEKHYRAFERQFEENYNATGHGMWSDPVLVEFYHACIEIEQTIRPHVEALLEEES